MSSSIWTQCAGVSEIRPLRVSPWRVVESQYHVSTRKLVDTIDEQAVLEALIDTSKPADPTRGRTHVLLATPFRYPPLAHGSRFGRKSEGGIWYGAESRRTMFAEAAYYRFVFLAGTAAALGLVTTWHTAFTVMADAARAVDLASAPFDAHRAAISSPTDYGEPQALGAAMRADRVALCRYRSARDVQGGTNIAVFDPAAFGKAKPRAIETWYGAATADRVEFVRRDWLEPLAFTFPRDEFLVNGALPSPAV